MALNFPNSPAVGDKYPVSPALGQPQYIWNGTMWTTHGVSASSPGQIPVYTDGSNAMTAQLTLVGDPLAATDAADKHYVDSIGSVRYDIAQSLSGGQQAQAQANMGLGHDIQAGTVMLFYQAAAPTGWTKLTTQNDKALRVVSGSGGVAGGTNPFSTVMAQAATGNHTLSRAELPSGILSNATQTITVYPSGNPSNYLPGTTGGWNSLVMDAFAGTTYRWPVLNPASLVLSNVTSISYAQNIQVASNNTTGGAHNHPVTMDIQYCDVILCSKN